MKVSIKTNDKIDVKTVNLKNDISGWEKIGDYDVSAKDNIELIFEREQKDNSLYTRVGSVRIIKKK